MNNPFDLSHIQDEKAEREARRLKLRTNLLIALFCATLSLFVAVLYQTQIVNGSRYRSNSVQRDIQTERVNSVRGEILDTYGRVLVTNELSYNVTLDYAAMGTRRNEVLDELLAICREEGVSWTSELRISDAPPWTYTSDTPLTYQQKNSDGELVTRRTYLGSLAGKCKWWDPDKEPEPAAPELFQSMCVTFGLIEKGETPTQAHRDLAGVDRKSVV